MQLIIGGAFQGKSAYAAQHFNLSDKDILDGEQASLQQMQQAKAVKHFHLWIRKMMQQDEEVMAAVRKLVEENPSLVIITDEVGCGIVPLDAFDRTWREAAGRVCCYLAKEASSVTRVIGGIPIIIKEEK